MTEPISVRTEAINTLRTLLGQSTGESSGDVALDELSNELSSTNTTTNTLANSIVSLKNSVALLKAQMELINETVKADLSTVEIKDPDAPTAEEQTGSGSTIKYTVEKGTIDSDNYLDDETHWIKHYTYDNLHLITYCMKSARAMDTNNGSVMFKAASFTDLTSVPDSGSCMGYYGDSNCFVIENNNVMVKRCAGISSSIAKDWTTTGHFYWFDRNSASKMFTFEDGYLVDANVASFAPFYATHAYVGNLHFLTIHTRTVKQLDKNTDYKIAQFDNNLSIPNANAMGEWVSNNGSVIRQGLVKAQDTKTITIKCTTNDVPINSFIAMNLIWIDSKATENATTIVNASGTSATSSDKYAKYLKRGHFNVVQVYGTISGSNNLAVFTDPVHTPDAEYVGMTFGIGASNGPMEVVRKTDVRTFYVQFSSSSAQIIYTYIWFA